MRDAGDWSCGLWELHMYHWDKMIHSPHNKIKSIFALADKSNDIVDICGTTTRVCLKPWRMHKTVVLRKIAVQMQGGSTLLLQLLMLPQKFHIRVTLGPLLQSKIVKNGKKLSIQ